LLITDVVEILRDEDGHVGFQTQSIPLAEPFFYALTLCLQSWAPYNY